MSFSRPLSTLAAVCAITLGATSCGGNEAPSAKGGDVTATVPNESGQSAAGPSGSADEPAKTSSGERASKPADANDQDGGGEGSRTDADTVPGGRTQAADEDAKVADVVTGMYRDFADGDAAGVCNAMTRAVRADIASQVLGGSTEPAGERTCVESMSEFAGAAAASGIREGSLNIEVTEVEVNGGAATATVELAGRGGKVELVKEEGVWRFGDSPWRNGR